MKRSPERALALDPEAVRELLAGAIEDWAGFRPQSCRVEELKRTERRVVARYDLGAGPRSASVIGKWFSTDRGATVFDALTYLRAHGFLGPEVAVPAPVAYLPDVRVLFVERVEGPLLRELLREEQSVDARAGAWLAAFHRSGLPSPRACGPEKQRRSVGRWETTSPQLAEVAGALDAALASLPDPGLPVHYDYYHSQIVVPPGATVTLDLDEAGLGDPAFDLAHYAAHLELLALQWTGDAAWFAGSREAFLGGYGGIAPLPEVSPVLDAFAWFKLAHQLVRREAPAEHRRHALERVRSSLSAA